MTTDFDDLVAATDTLRDKAEEALKQILKTNPNDHNVLWRLAEVCRQKGILDAALYYYQRLLELQTDHRRAIYLSAILEEQDLGGDISFEHACPAPWVQMRDFLTQVERQQVWEQARKYRSRFRSSELAGGQVDRRGRSSQVLYKHHLGEIGSWFLERLESEFSGKWPQLQMLPLRIDHRELQLTRHSRGDFFKIHKDSGSGDQSRTRRVTFVYYFHGLSKRFTGGDLLLYDTDLKLDTCATAFTRIEPLNNSIIFFPSHFYHQVTPFLCEMDDFEDGRFTLNGWLHSETER